MLPQFVLLLALGGFLVSLHIFLTKRQKKELVCKIGEKSSCNTVVESKYNKTFGIANEILGIFYYLFVLILSATIIFDVTVAYRMWLLLISGGIAVLMSLYFTYLQGFVIKKWCYYCLASAVFSIAIFVLELDYYF